MNASSSRHFQLNGSLLISRSASDRLVALIRCVTSFINGQIHTTAKVSTSSSNDMGYPFISQFNSTNKLENHLYGLVWFEPLCWSTVPFNCHPDKWAEGKIGWRDRQHPPVLLLFLLIPCLFNPAFIFHRRISSSHYWREFLVFKV